ncbi:MAG: hypothetical protein IPG01_18070 [Chitinophagaceae bacterium]|nr:hypothetical protein [Chitinophagaceae bacterium]
MKTLAIIILAIGVLMTVITGFNIITKEKVVDLGTIEISKKESTPVYWSPITGMVLAGAGLVILVLSNRKK